MIDLSAYLTVDNPLGPIKHDSILRRQLNNGDSGVRSDLLLYRTSTFDRHLENSGSYIIGRRGAGKTAIAAAILTSKNRSGDYSFKIKKRSRQSNDIYVFISAWDHLHKIINNVGARITASKGWSGDWDSVLVEQLAEAWAEELWREIFSEIYNTWTNDKDENTPYKEVIEFFRGDDFDASSQITQERFKQSVERCKSAIIDQLNNSNCRCVIIIDSLDEYPISSPKFSRTISGLLRAISDFRDDHPAIQVRCCLPKEMVPILRRQTANVLKDFPTEIDALEWNAADLMTVVAQRYREFLRIHCEQANFVRKIDALNLDDRKDLNEFFGLVMADTIQNYYSSEESTLAYIIRHTQLLPREFLRIFNLAIKIQYKAKRTWSFIDSDAIREAIAKEESNMLDHILAPFATIYPELGDYCRKLIPELQPIFTMSDLDRVISRFPAQFKDNFVDLRALFFEMGIIGYVDDNTDQHNMEYAYGRFHYNSVNPITFRNDKRYCIHPVFSGSWNMRRDDSPHEFVYPAGVESEL